MRETANLEVGWRYVVRWLRMQKNWTQQRLADACGLHRDMISRYEQGHEVPGRRTRQKLAAGTGISVAEMELMLPVLTRKAAAGELPMSTNEPGEGDLPAVMTIVSVLEAAIGRIGAELAPSRARAWQEAGDWAEAAWQTFLACEPWERLILVEKGPSFRGWTFCDRLLTESESAGPRDAERAVELARLGRRAADLAADAEDWRPILQGQAESFLGNALRVAGDLSSAEKAFLAARRLLAIPCEDPGHLDPTRPLDLEASLRRDQQRYGEALALLGKALARAKDASAAARLWLKRSAVLQQKGDLVDSITALKRAAALMDPKREPRLLFGTRFNLAANLLDLGRASEASFLLPEIRSLARALGNELDLVRLRWLEGKVAAAQGQLAEAARAIGEAHQAFVDRRIAYDSAFTALDLAEVHLRRGQRAEVRELALGTMEVLRAQKVAGGFLAAFQLFCQAAERDAATAELVRRTVRELERSRGGPE